jgi:tetratricopeptide (TPR) repeat protein
MQSSPPVWARFIVRFGWFLPVICVFALWAFTVPFGFVWDDEHDILFNDHVHSIAPSHWFWDSRRPLVMLTFALNWAWTGSDAWSYRLVNIAVHATNAVLVWSCVRRGLRTVANAAFKPLRAASFATVVATIWAVHPLQTSAVTYVVHRYESMCALMMLATLAAWQRGCVARAPARWFALAALAATAAIVSKEIAVVGPVLLVAYDFAFSKDDPSGANAGVIATRRQRTLGLVGVCASAYVVALAIYPQVPPTVSQGSTAGVTRWAYFRSEFGVIVRYFRLAAWPHPLSVDYYDWPVAQSWRAVAAPTIAVVLLLVAIAWACLRAPRFGWLGLAFFAILAPTSTLYPLGHELLAERRLYLPLAPLLVAVAIGVAESTRLRARSLVALASVATLLLGALTVLRNSDYRSPLALFEHDVTARPDNARLHFNVAHQLVLARRLAEAWPHFERTFALEPRRFKSQGEMAMIAAELGWVDRAIAHMEPALNESPDDEHLWLGATVFYASIGRDVEARRIAEHAVELFPSSEAAAEKLAWVLATARDPAVVDGDVATREAERAIHLAPVGGPPVSSIVTLAAARAAAGAFGEAQVLATQVLELARANHADAWTRLIETQLAAYAAGTRWIGSGNPAASRTE